METHRHSLQNLFAQLGLPDDGESIAGFIASHRPLPNGVMLHDAPFWTPNQSAFLRDEIIEDADWAEVIDSLNGSLHS